MLVMTRRSRGRRGSPLEMTGGRGALSDRGSGVRSAAPARQMVLTSESRLVRQEKPWRGGCDDVANQSGNLAMEPSGFESRPAKVGHQPEASLAWCTGDRGCEA